MGVMDKFISAMKLSEDEDDGYYDDDFYDDDPEPMRKPASGKDTDNAEDDKVRKITPKVTPLRQTKKMGTGMEVCVIKPTTVEDAREITETLLANRTVVLNLEGLDVDIARVPVSRSRAICRRYPITFSLLRRRAWIFPATFRISCQAPSMCR